MHNASIYAAVERLSAHKGPVVAIAELPQPHLALACIMISTDQYCIWTVNLQVVEKYDDCGCSHGYYFSSDKPNNRELALQEFAVTLGRKWA